MFKIGDKIRILSNIDNLIDDFSGGYVEEMKLDLGKETEIIEIYKEDEEFIGYILKDSEYVWDERALELIKIDEYNIDSTLITIIENWKYWNFLSKKEEKTDDK